MPFMKTGDAPIAAVYCPCGGQIDSKTKKCTRCGKEHDQGADQPAPETPQVTKVSGKAHGL
jgi:hypothetical protein